MPEHEADRIARANERRQKEAEEEQRLEVDIPKILRLLVSQGYPGIVVVRGRRRGVFRSERAFEKSGWPFGGFHREPYVSCQTYLLSDGQIYYSRSGERWQESDVIRLNDLARPLANALARDVPRTDRYFLQGHIYLRAVDVVSACVRGLEDLHRQLEAK